MIEYREKQGYDDEQQIPEANKDKASRWREQILVGDVETFFDEAFEAIEQGNRIENGLYNRSGQYYSLLEQKGMRLITEEMFELAKINAQLSLLDIVDRVQTQEK